MDAIKELTDQGIYSQDGRRFVEIAIQYGELPEGTDAGELMAQAHRARQGRRFAMIPGTARGVLDCKSGRVCPTPVVNATDLDARDWMMELEYAF